MTRAFLGVALTLLLPACADHTPNSDVQISCEGEHAAELCAHAANAAAELNPHLPFWVEVRDHEVVGVTWRDAEQWRIVTVPDETVITTPSGASTTISCPRRLSIGATAYHERTIYVGDCVFRARWGWSLAETVRHEIGHALGHVGHIGGAENIMRPQATQYRGTPPDASYSPADIAALVEATRDGGRPDTILEALSH